MTNATHSPHGLFENSGRLRELLDRFRQARIAVVGDFFLDRYLVIDPKLAEPSLETGLTANQIVGIRNSPGAAGTVVNNLFALQAGRLIAIGVIGDDAYGFELRRELENRRVDTTHLLAAADRFTPTYTKPMFLEPNGEREGERLDIINRTPTPANLEEAVLRAVDEVAPKVDAVIVLDQVINVECGVVTPRVRQGLGELAQRHAATLFYADSRSSIGEFRHMLIKANQHEALRSADMGGGTEDDETLAKAGKELQRRTGKAVFITCGPRGILVTSSEDQKQVPGCPVSGPIDVTGAGDSASAGIVLSLCGKATLPQAAYVGNLVASITVQQLGTTGSASPQQVLDRFEQVMRNKPNA